MRNPVKKGGTQDKGSDVADVVVAVKVSKEIHKAALEWALTHVVQPGSNVTLLVVVSSNYGKRFWGFKTLFGGECSTGRTVALCGPTNHHQSAEETLEITNCWTQMIHQLHEVYDPNRIKIKIVSGHRCVATADEAMRADWVVLDRHLKHEAKHCMEQLQCNIVIMKRYDAKVLRLNLAGSPAKKQESMSFGDDQSRDKTESKVGSLNPTHGAKRESKADSLNATHSSEMFTTTEAEALLGSSSDHRTSSFIVAEKENMLEKEEILEGKQARDLDESSSALKKQTFSSSSSLMSQTWMRQDFSSPSQPLEHLRQNSGIPSIVRRNSATKDMLEKLSRFKERAGSGSTIYKSYLNCSSSLREMIHLSRAPPPGPPPLCSICQHKAPEIGKPPRWFAYAELELATGGFSQDNFLAKGGFGSVHLGILPDGQAIAVKQNKLASSRGDREFCSEVEVLSCAQHRNVVMLIGFCIEDGRRLLVYEYICNGSVDYHLYGQNQDTLSWTARQKIAVGAARGLRYLHQECRVGCIVHRDMRPNNILVTHDFEPLVGDFGLARWQPDGQKGVETKVIGAFGYLAPEYAQSGQITEKADVYSFGVVLLVLVTGHKAVELNRPRGQQCLTEWARSLFEAGAINELVDPRLRGNYSENEVYRMLHAASLCIRQDPDMRPRVSKVLRILEGDMMDSCHNLSRDSGPISTTDMDLNSRIGRIKLDRQLKHVRTQKWIRKVGSEHQIKRARSCPPAR